MQAQFSRLLAASGTMHAADQLTLAAIPLIAAAAGADPVTIGLLVAAQSAAWLLVSLPAGALADRLSRRTMLMFGALAVIVASLVGWSALNAPGAPLALLGLACFVTASGVVIIVLSVFALLPRIVEKSELPRANARLELARAMATLAAPSIAAWLVVRAQGDLIFALTGVCGIVALIASRMLPRDEAPAAASPPILAAIRDGARFVAAHPTLRAIGLCAIFWNIAFFALVGLFTPFAVQTLGLDAHGIGRAWSAMGAGLMAAALLAPAIAARASLTALLLFGPLVSCVAGVIVLLASRATPEPVLWLAFFLIGFGPMLWSVVQTSLRQSVTPPELMGRVGATLQVAIFGVRPLGAILAGWTAGHFGLAVAAMIPLLLWIASLASIVWLLRPALAAAAAAPAR